MASLGASGVLCCSSIPSSSPSSWREMIRAIIDMPKKLRNGRVTRVSLPKLTNSPSLVEELDFRRSGYTNSTTTHIEKVLSNPLINRRASDTNEVSDPLVMEKLYAIMGAVEDRVEMHKNMGGQRNNWNSLLLTSINTITLTAATMAGIAGTVVGTGGAPLSALKLSSTLLYLAATGMLIIMNRIQPSQLVEEQRNAARLFKQLHAEIRTMVSLGNPLTMDDVNQAMDKVLALDRAFPLPLLGAMLKKFPATMEPAVWWPQPRLKQAKRLQYKRNNINGWNAKLEEEMGEIVLVLKKKDKADYLRLGEKALKLNKALAISGPLLTGLAAIGSALVGSPSHGPWTVVLGVVAGALSSIVNAVQHGGQVGMVFEMYRGNAGFFRLMEEFIQSNLKEEVERRENGELFEMKVSLQLGRSLSELKDLATSSSIKGEAIDEFASKLF